MRLPTILINDLDKNYELIKVPVELFEQDGVIKCCDYRAVDYYGEFRGDTMWISPALEKYAAKLGKFWEWDNAECISLCNI